MMIKRNLVLLALLLTCASGVCAQQAQLSPEKRTLIKELLEVMHVKQTAQSISDSLALQMRAERARMLSERQSRQANGAGDEHWAISDELKNDGGRWDKRVDELFRQRVDIGRLTEDASYELYDKYYSEDDLKNLVTFYKSETGRKSIELAPKLFAESMERTAAVLRPVVQEIMAQVLSEEEQELQAKQQPVAPTPRQQPTSKPRRKRP